MKPVGKRRRLPTTKEIAKEWDKVCFERDRQITDHSDISYHYVTTPYIIRALKRLNANAAIEIGCGSGRLAQKVLLETSIAHIDAIDISPKSINLARHNVSNDLSISFKVSSADQIHTNAKYDVCFCNMVFMDDPHYPKTIKRISACLKPFGYLVFTITHPCFWPYYWKYDHDDGFDYLQECPISSEFKTSMTSSIGVTTHIHRPLEYYINELTSNNLFITDFTELRPSGNVSPEYKYRYPRFLGITVQKR